MRLQQHAVDLLQVDDFGAVADSLQQRAKAQVLEAPEHAFGRADDERERVVGEGAVRERDLVELARGRSRSRLSGAIFCIKTE